MTGKLTIDYNEFELSKFEILELFQPKTAILVLKTLRQGGTINVSSKRIKREHFEQV